MEGEEAGVYGQALAASEDGSLSGSEGGGGGTMRFKETVASFTLYLFYVSSSVYS